MKSSLSNFTTTTLEQKIESVNPKPYTPKP